MKNRKTRAEKERAEIRRLKEENDRLKTINKVLTEKLNNVPQNSKNMIVKKNIPKVVFMYIYDIVVSALMLVSIYWIAILGHEDFNVPYNCIIALVGLISIKCLFDNKAFHIKRALQVIMNDLTKPFLSMLLGLVIFMLCLGKEWKEAQNYAMDVINTGIIIAAILVAIMAIFLESCIILELINQKNNKKKSCQ